jgi:hypothetical protein
VTTLRAARLSKWEFDTLQGQQISSPTSDGFLLRLLFEPEDWGDMFLRNTKLSHKYTALQPRGQRLKSHDKIVPEFNQALRHTDAPEETEWSILIIFNIGSH